jgi:hypothetical protein
MEPEYLRRRNGPNTVRSRFLLTQKQKKKVRENCIDASFMKPAQSSLLF